MNKTILLIGVFAAAFLMVSGATAVPQAQSKTVKNQLKSKNVIDIKLSNLKEKTLNFLDNNEKLNIKPWDPSDGLLYMLLHLLACALDAIDEFLEDLDWRPGQVILNAIYLIIDIILMPFYIIAFFLAFLFDNLVEYFQGVMKLFQEFIDFIRDEIINDPSFMK